MEVDGVGGVSEMIKSEACSMNTYAGLEKLNDLAIVTECRLGSPSGKSRADKVLVLGGYIWSRCMGKYRQRGRSTSSHHSAPHSTTVLHSLGSERLS